MLRKYIFLCYLQNDASIYQNQAPAGSCFESPIVLEEHSRKSKWAKKSKKQSNLTAFARRKGSFLAPGYNGMPKDKSFWLDALEDFYPFFDFDQYPLPEWFEVKFPAELRDDGFLIFDHITNEVLIWNAQDKEWKIKYGM